MLLQALTIAHALASPIAAVSFASPIAVTYAFSIAVAIMWHACGVSRRIEEIGEPDRRQEW